MATQLEARLRVRAETDQAAAGVRRIKTEVQGLDEAASKAAGSANAAAASAKKLGEAPKGLPKLKGDADAAAKALQRTQRQAALLVPQLNDIFTQLASGASPLTVLVQQGPQIRDVMGSWSNAGKALLSVFTPLRVAIGGAAAAAGVFALAAFKGSQESSELARAIAFTGNAAGVTAGQVGAMTARIAEQTKQSRGDVRETLTELIASGRFTITSLASAAQGVAAFAKATGRTREQAVGDYLAMADGVTAWVTKYDRAINFLTPQQLKQIRTLESLGKTQEAMALASDLLNEAIKRQEPPLGSLARAWRDVKNAVDGYWESLKRVLDPNPSAEQQFQRMAERVQQLRDLNEPRFQPRLERAQRQLQDAFRRGEVEQGNSQATADALAKNRREKEQQEAAYQNALAQLLAAGAAKRLAELQTQLDDERDSVERAHARGLVAEREYQDKLLGIEQKRAEAQAAALREQRAIEEARLGGLTKTVEIMAQQAKLAQLDAQIIEAQSRATTKAVQRRKAADAAALTEAQTKAQEWAAVWQRAADAVRQFAERKPETDPAERARKEAEIAVAEAERVFKERKIELEVRIRALTAENEAGMRAELQKLLDKLVSEAPKAIAEDGRRTRFDSLQRSFADESERLELQERAIDQEAGTTEEAERRKNAARAESARKLQEIRDLAADIAKTPAERNVVEQMRQRTEEAKRTLDELRDTARGAAINGLSTALTDIVTGAKHGKEALLDMVQSFARAMLDVISRRLAEQLVESFIPKNGGGGGGGGGWAALASWFATLFHSGGVVGAPGGTRRAVPAAAFVLAPRYHGGGIAGLMPDEVPAILRAGEEVLRSDDPRHRDNLRSGARVGDVSISVRVDGASGTQNELQQGGEVLARGLRNAVRAEVESWVINQKRPGGILA